MDRCWAEDRAWKNHAAVCFNVSQLWNIRQTKISLTPVSFTAKSWTLLSCTEFRYSTWESQTIFNLTRSSLLAWSFHKNGALWDWHWRFPFWMWSLDERRDGFSLINYLWCILKRRFSLSFSSRILRLWSRTCWCSVGKMCYECRIQVWTMQIFVLLGFSFACFYFKDFSLKLNRKHT